MSATIYVHLDSKTEIKVELLRPGTVTIDLDAVHLFVHAEDIARLRGAADEAEALFVHAEDIARLRGAADEAEALLHAPAE